MWWTPTLSVFPDQTTCSGAADEYTFSSECETITLPLGLGSFSATLTCSSASSYALTVCNGGCAAGSTCTTGDSATAGVCNYLLPVFGPAAIITCRPGPALITALSVSSAVLVLSALSCCYCVMRRRRAAAAAAGGNGGYVFMPTGSIQAWGGGGKS